MHDDNANINDQIGHNGRVNSQSDRNALPSQILNYVPIFPLRKFPRFPTDRLTLNLYEERYLEMADFILSSRPAIFGAIFVSGKPHLVTNGGMGSIVPLLQQSDIGTLFIVNDWQDDSLPVSGSAVQAFQRRVRLNAIGFARFQITSIVSDGTQSFSSARELSSTCNSGTVPGRPYIQANLTLLCDQDDSSTNNLTQLEYEESLKSLRKSNKKDSHDMMDPILEFSEIHSTISCRLSNEPSSLVPNNEELFSFFVVSKLLNAQRQSPVLLVSYLESLSTRERLQGTVDIFRAQ